MSASLRVSEEHFERLKLHLFRADHDEHAAILLAGVQHREGATTLLGRELHLLANEDFPPGVHGYRQLAAGALARVGNRANSERLALLTIHSHPGAGRQTGLSADDLAGHARVFPHLKDIVGGRTVGGIALGEESSAGEIWLDTGDRQPLAHVRVVGELARTLYPKPPRETEAEDTERFDRQVRLFGSDGQRILRDLHVGVIGAGGGGSLILEQLAHLGVGEITAVDFDAVAVHNLSRIVGARARDARRSTKKVEVARRLAARIDPSVRFNAIDGDIADAAVAKRIALCDFIFLAGDTHLSRLVVNALAHAYLIPAVQIGAKADARSDGTIEQLYCAVRPILPPSGCLHCAGAIDPHQIHLETSSVSDRAAQNYLGLDTETVDPSVITLNAAGAAAATNLFLLSSVGLAQHGLGAHRIYTPADGRWLTLKPRQTDGCPWCSGDPHSRFARGEDASLPVRVTTPLPRRNLIGRLLHRRSFRY